MAPTKRKHHHQPPAPPPSPPTSSFIPAISTVAVAQICVSVGYTSAEPSALRSLSSIASLYLRTLATSAASIAASKGRTQSNVLDLIRAIEELSLQHGFAGASDPTRPLLKSSVVKELRRFVRSVDEIPFAKPIRKSSPGSSAQVRRSFAEAGREPPWAHVPRWLPCFPEGWEEGGGEERSTETTEVAWLGLGSKEEENGNARRMVLREKTNGVRNNKALVVVVEEEGLLEVERDKVKFRIQK